jgi:uncharacterized membrane-anchored protein
MMKRLLKLAVALAAFAGALPAAAQAQAQAPAPTPQELARDKQLRDILASLHPKSGDVAIPGAEAVLHLGKDYYYLPPDEAKRVIVEGWKNPPSVAEGVLGLVLPAGKTFLDDTWGAVITWEPMGYVTDDDARTADYTKILTDMQSGEEEINEGRRKEGYPAQHLVGWAQPPSYDATTHSVVWAQDVAFEGQSVDSLNYDVRLLGRKGVLSLNMLDSMAKLPQTREAAAAFARSVEFTPGARYADYKSGDTKAGIGIAGLVAAGVGVVAAKKLGLIAIVLLFAKKFLVIIVAAFAALGARFRKLFGIGRDKLEGAEPSAEAAPAAEPASYEPAAAAPAAEPASYEAPADETAPGRVD